MRERVARHLHTLDHPDGVRQEVLDYEWRGYAEWVREVYRAKADGVIAIVRDQTGEEA